MKKFGRWKVDKIIWLSVSSCRNDGWFEESVGEQKKCWGVCEFKPKNISKQNQNVIFVWPCIEKSQKVNAEHVFPKVTADKSKSSLHFVMSLNYGLKAAITIKNSLFYSSVLTLKDITEQTVQQILSIGVHTVRKVSDALYEKLEAQLVVHNTILMSNQVECKPNLVCYLLLYLTVVDFILCFFLFSSSIFQ